ncbi:MAG: TonB-dependent receptor [bacterium]|nr:TonB-dependent receptor [bacterium]
MGKLVTILLYCSLSLAQSALTGVVTDWSNGRPIAGAIVEVELDTAAVTDQFGRYLTAPFNEASIVIRISHAGFAPYSAMIVLADAEQTEFNVELKPFARGSSKEQAASEAPQYEMEDVTVTTTRASSDYPVTFANLDRTEIERTNYGQDLPMLFTQLPSINTYSDGGSGFGYSYLRVRGFSQNRVGVYLNGIPLNDAESHEVFWIDLPDFADDVQDVQVQRGVGSSLYGAAALGGSINLMTTIPGQGDRPKLRAEGMYGTWNTRRASVQFTSGRVGKQYGFAGRLTRMDTDGYRNGSWVKTWSYYLAASRFTGRHTTRMIFYGGPERTHLAYEGVTKEYLNGEVTGNKDDDRRHNPLSYRGVDDFFQPHYELHDTWRLRDNLMFDNSIYVFRGNGYYDQFRTDVDLAQYFPVLPADSVYANVLRRRNIAEIDGGWVPRVAWTHRYGQTVAGAELRLHEARHEGLVRWASQLPDGATPDQHYYDYHVAKQVYSGYVHNLIKVSEPLRAMLDLQVKSQRYELSDDQLFDVTLDKRFTAVTPRAGVTYRLLKGDADRHVPLSLGYCNVSLAQREPAFRDLYNAQDYYSSPVIAPNRFADGSSGGEYVGPMLTDEKLLNIELGAIAQWRRAHLGINYYRMDLTDAIVTDNGQLDDLGNLLSANADRVRHQGVELVGAIEPVRDLQFSGNLALADHKFIDYSEVDWNTYQPASRNGNRIGQDPSYLANVQVAHSHGRFSTTLSARFVGKQFTDNSENDETAIGAYSLVNADFGYRFVNLPGDVPLVELRLTFSNVLDAEYEAVGYGPTYIVGAPRAVYATLAVEL